MAFRPENPFGIAGRRRSSLKVALAGFFCKRRDIGAVVIDQKQRGIHRIADIYP